MNNYYSVKFKVYGNYETPETLEVAITDIINTIVLPALGVSEVPRSVEVKRARA